MNIHDAFNAPMCCGTGKYDTRKNEPGEIYPTLTWPEIEGLAESPSAVDKSKARWLIPSSYVEHDARNHEAQRRHGLYHVLPGDVDQGNHSLTDIANALRGLFPNSKFLIHSSRSATEDDRKWRFLIPLAEPVAGADYRTTQKALFNILEAQGIVCDRAFENTGQPVFLPNQGAFYEAHLEPGRKAALTGLDGEINAIAKHELRAKKQAEHERIEAQKKRLKRIAEHGEGQSPVDAFNDANGLPGTLLSYGYEYAGGDHWISPNSQSRGASVRVYGDRWISLTASDEGIGRQSAGGAWSGDAFDLFVHYEFVGKYSDAVRNYAKEIADDQGASADTGSSDTGSSEYAGQWDDWATGPNPKDPPAKPPAPKKTLTLQTSAEFCAARQPADYLVDGSLRDGWLYTLTAPTGHGKSAVALTLAYSVAAGGWLGSHEVKQGSVLFLAGENHDDIRERWIAMCEKDHRDPDELAVTFMPGVWDLKQQLHTLAEHFADNPLRLVVVDTLAAFFSGDNENDNSQQQAFATEVLRPLTELPGRPTVVVPSHPTKGAGKDALTPKGGSSLLNAIDGNLSAWNTDGTVKVHWQGKFRGAPWKPMHFELSEHVSDKLKDSKGQPMPTVVARAMLDSEIGNAIEQSQKIENQILKLLADGLSVRDIADDVVADGQRGVTKYRAEACIKRLKDLGWIKKKGRVWEPTGQGWEVLKQAGSDAQE